MMRAFPNKDELGNIIVEEDNIISFFTEDGRTLRVGRIELGLNPPPNIEIKYGAEKILLCLDSSQQAPEQPAEAQDSAEPQDAREQERSAANPTTEFEWTDAPSLLYLSLYEQHMGQLGSKFKNKKKLFEKIAADMRAQPYNYNVTVEQIINRDKTLLRLMKGYVKEVGPKGTGRARRFLKHEEIVVRLYGRKHNVAPKYISSSLGEVTQDDLIARAGFNTEPLPSDIVNNEAGPSREPTPSSSGGPSTAPPLTPSVGRASIAGPSRINRPPRESSRLSVVLSAVRDGLKRQNDHLEQRSLLFEKWAKEDLLLKRENLKLKKERNEIMKLILQNYLKKKESEK